MINILTKDKLFYKSLFFLALPMILQNLITFSVGLADNIMIGNLGDSAVSGVYIGNQIQTVIQVIMGGIESTLILLSSQYWGQKDKDSILKIITIGTRISFIIGIIFTITTSVFTEQIIRIFTSEEEVITEGIKYLSIVSFSFVLFCLTEILITSMRSIESAQIGMIVSSISLVINIILNYLLIFGHLFFPKLGIEGAAIATLIARIIEFLTILIYIIFFDQKLKIRFKDFFNYLDKSLFIDFIKYGLPLMAGQVVWGANLVANSIILGHFSTPVITATSITNTVNSFMYVGMNGLSGAIGIIIGKTVGSGDLSKIKEYSRTTQIILLGLGISMSLIFAVFMEPYICIYNISDEACYYSRQFINVLRVTGIGTCYEAGCLMGLIKSGGDVKFVFINDTIHVFLIVIPLAIITYYIGAQPWVVFACLKCDQILKCIPAFIKIRRYNWMKNLTRN